MSVPRYLAFVLCVVLPCAAGESDTAAEIAQLKADIEQLRKRLNQQREFLAGKTLEQLAEIRQTEKEPHRHRAITDELLRHIDYDTSAERVRMLLGEPDWLEDGADCYCVARWTLSKNPSVGRDEWGSRSEDNDVYETMMKVVYARSGKVKYIVQTFVGAAASAVAEIPIQPELVERTAKLSDARLRALMLRERGCTVGIQLYQLALNRIVAGVERARVHVLLGTPAFMFGNIELYRPPARLWTKWSNIVLPERRMLRIDYENDVILKWTFVESAQNPTCTDP